VKNLTSHEYWLERPSRPLHEESLPEPAFSLAKKIRVVRTIGGCLPSLLNPWLDAIIDNSCGGRAKNAVFSPSTNSSVSLGTGKVRGFALVCRSKRSSVARTLQSRRPGVVVAATRRLAAVLAADLVGYSRLMGFDEEGTLVRLRALRTELLDPKIAGNNGRLVKTTGDGFLVEFNSVIDALRCAKDVQLGMAGQATIEPDRRFMLRIGVHQGDIVVEDGDIFGNGVNIAARLEGIAEPGGICVSERVQEDAAGRIDLVFVDMGEQQLKNIARPIRAFHVRIKELEIGALADGAPVETLQEEEPAPAEEAAILPDTIPERPTTFPFLAESSTSFRELPPGEPCSPDRLQELVSQWLGLPVEIVATAGTWVPLSPERRIRMPVGNGSGVLHQLGVDTTIGARAWKPKALVIRIGPLDRASFEALLPDQHASQRLIALVRSFLGPETEFAISPIMAGREITPLCLDAQAGMQLGWNTWISPARDSDAEIPDSDDAFFRAHSVAAEDRRSQAATEAAPVGQK
jgi:class 3 adenylate cyclase